MAAALPALPAARRIALASAAGVAPADVAVVVEQDLDTLVHAAVAAGGDAKTALKRAANEVAGRHIEETAFVALVKMETDGQLTTSQARDVLNEVLESGGDPAAIADAKGFKPVDTGALEAIVAQVIADSPDEVAKYKGGEQKVLVTPRTSVVSFEPASRADLKPGAPVFINAAERQPDGTYKAPRVNVGLNGQIPPM